MGLLFGSTDNPNRLNAEKTEDLNLSLSGAAKAICGRQWKEKLKAAFDTPNPFSVLDKELQPAGSFSAVGMNSVSRIAIQFDGHTDFVRTPPYLILRDMDNARFVLFLNKSLAGKTASIRVCANEYELARYGREELGIDAPPGGFSPMCFADSELRDTWIRIAHRGESSFTLSFSDSTPSRRFSAIDVLSDKA